MLTDFDFSLRGRKYGGRGWKKRAVIYLNIAVEYTEIIIVDIHEMLHAMLHKLGVRGWKNEKIIDRLTELIIPELIVIWAHNGYLQFWHDIEIADFAVSS